MTVGDALRTCISLLIEVLEVISPYEDDTNEEESA